MLVTWFRVLLKDRALGEYEGDNNEAGAHQSLDTNAPEPREEGAVGGVTSTPVPGGLHHRYSHPAA